MYLQVHPLKPGEDWRWQTHLANVPVFYEFKNNNVDLTGDAAKTLTSSMLIIIRTFLTYI